MKKYLLINQEGKVKSYSDAPIGFDPAVMRLLEVDITEDELADIKNNYRMSVVDDKLMIEKPEYITAEENKQSLKTSLEERLKDPKTQLSDIADTLLQLLN